MKTCSIVTFEMWFSGSMITVVVSGSVPPKSTPDSSSFSEHMVLTYINGEIPITYKINLFWKVKYYLPLFLFTQFTTQHGLLILAANTYPRDLLAECLEWYANTIFIDGKTLIDANKGSKFQSSPLLSEIQSICHQEDIKINMLALIQQNLDLLKSL